jgi:hypothetical protein
VNSDCKERLEDIFNSLLEILDEHKVSPEDGALLSANLLFSSLNHLHEEDIEDLHKTIESFMQLSSVEHSAIAAVRPSNNPYFLIGLNKGWGLDPSLLDEEN